MEAKHVRLIKEFEDLYVRYWKLMYFIIEYHKGNITVELTTPMELLLEQSDVMKRYLAILCERFKYEEIFHEVHWKTLNKKRLEIFGVTHDNDIRRND